MVLRWLKILGGVVWVEGEEEEREEEWRDSYVVRCSASHLKNVVRADE